ncbi:HNH endonuclease [Fluviicola chungangensis]|uniref:HNH endonuclease n=1 Tax=Fluviicola chungangensis TaxID=2597671 RepID=A0A556MGU3_9FLAO|nr:HNH endonuclease [Fluviicola chungangensis]TSJ39079.1 HNH endonuclease [Fluviicola chungangensis]
MPHPFNRLRRDYKYGGAPHKPVLLLAILELIRKGEILNNRIAITPELVLEFKSIWSRLVVTPHIPNFALPFYHMKSEPFWKLVTSGGMEIPVTSSNSIRSLNALKESVAFAEIEPTVFAQMLDPLHRTVLEEALLDQYFPETKGRFRSLETDLFSQLETEILREDPVIYRKRIDELKETLSKEEFEEEVFVRGGVFKREVPKIYNYQCAISGMRIESSTNAQMIDACHLIPFAVSKDDTITNGIALSPNLHRAYDRGLITITEDYLVKISPAVSENDSPYSLGQFNGKQILLPKNTDYYPSVENLRWHHRECFVAC